MKKTSGKAAAKHNAAKVAAKVASATDKIQIAAENVAQEIGNAVNAMETAGDAKVAQVKEEVKAVVEMVKEVKPEVAIQFRHYEVDMEEVTKRVKEDFEVRGNRGVEIKRIQIYVKPEDFTAYYVINDCEAGKVNLF